MVAKADEVQVLEPPKKKNSKLKIVGIVVLIALVACACGYYYVGMKNPAGQMAKKDMKSVTLPSLTVNLEDAGYMKTTITLEYPSSKKLDDELAKNLYKVKDSVISVLRNTTADSLKNPQETEALKQRLLKEINSTLTSGKVTGLYFEEFIVQ